MKVQHTNYMQYTTVIYYVYAFLQRFIHHSLAGEGTEGREEEEREREKGRREGERERENKMGRERKESKGSERKKRGEIKRNVINLGMQSGK